VSVKKNYKKKRDIRIGKIRKKSAKNGEGKVNQKAAEPGIKND